jgi:hypothetical protein
MIALTVVALVCCSVSLVRTALLLIDLDSWPAAIWAVLTLFFGFVTWLAGTRLRDIHRHRNRG